MMWILPKQLHTFPYVQDTGELISDLNEQSQACEQSLLVRSKPTPARTWLRKWKRDSWTRHLSGRMLKPSLGATFVARWIYCQADIPASPSQQQVNDLERTIQDTFGLILQKELDLCSLDSVSLKMSRDTSAWDSEKLLASWKASVIKQRGEYSARQKLVRPTGGNESSLWPTPCAMEAQKAGTYAKGQMGKSLVAMGNRGELMHEFPTPCARDYRDNGKSPAELNRNSVTLATIAGGRLNADWVEWLMGIPIGWTDCDCAAMGLSQQLPH